MILLTQKRSAFLRLVVLAAALIFSVSLASCESVEDEVREGVEQVEQKVVTEAKKLVWRHVSDGLEKLKDTIRNDEEKGVDWARSEVAKVREGLQTVVGKADGGRAAGLEWVDEELRKLDEKLADQKNADQVIAAIDEFMENLKTELGVAE